MNSSRSHEPEMEMESQKAWLRKAASAVYTEPAAEEVSQYLKQLWESEQADVQLRMLVRCCCESLEKQFPGKFSYAFLEETKAKPDVVTCQKIALDQEKDSEGDSSARSAKEILS